MPHACSAGHAQLTASVTRIAWLPAGLSDERQREACSRLQQEAEGLAGSMMLGHLCEVVRDVLTALNSPEGDCVFCRCALVDDPAQGTSCSQEDQPVRLPCYHVYHL